MTTLIKQTIQIIIQPDEDLNNTLLAFQSVKQQLSEPAFNNGKPLNQLDLHKVMYKNIKGTLNSQMNCSAIRSVAAAYVSSKKNNKPAKKPFKFHKAHALFLIGNRGRDAKFKKDCLSIWTINGRKKLSYFIPDYFKESFNKAVSIDSINIKDVKGKLIGYVCLSLEVPDAKGVNPVGIDLNETNILVAVDNYNRELFISGKPLKIANTKTRKRRKRLKAKLKENKVQGRGTRSVRRNLKRLSSKQSNRTNTFCQTVAKQVVGWSPQNAVLVLEDLHIPQVSKKMKISRGVKRRLSQWAFSTLTQCIRASAAKAGVLVELVNPAHTSTHCRRCGLRGERKRHKFACPNCYYEGHADINAAVNIRNRYTALRGSGAMSAVPEART